MTESAHQFYEDLRWVRKRTPLVHNITNYVVMNSTANALLAAGASPVMAHCKEEVQEMASIAQALVLNIGTLTPDWVESMVIAGQTASDRNIPIILDPVGAGATTLRTKSCAEILEKTSVSIIRGNASEIAALAGYYHLLENPETLPVTKGVDSTILSDTVIGPAHALAMRFDLTVAVTGQTDFITDGVNVTSLTGGSPLMAAVTGMGCTSSALCGAFAALFKPTKIEMVKAATSALGAMKAAGKIAEVKATGPGTFFPHFLDAVYNLKSNDYSSVGTTTP